MRLALVHDWLNQWGGAEDVLEALMSYYPQAPIFTSIYDREIMPAHWSERDFQTLWLDRFPGIYEHHQRYLPLYPVFWGKLDLSHFDVVLSNKSGFCHGFKSGAETLHICYCLAPTRYVWQFEHYAARENLNETIRWGVERVLPWLQEWDFEAAQRVHHFIAISHDIQERIQQFYKRDSIVIYPPVEVKERFHPVPPEEVGNYYLSLGRLIPYKRVDLAVQACTRLNLPLKVGGTGRDIDRLKDMAGPTIEFLGFVPDEDLPDLFAHCKAFIFPGMEDFGITPVQAQAAGRPVIAYRGGGALDTVVEERTGLFFDEQTVESLMDALERFERETFDPILIRQHALQFDSSVFRQQMTVYIEQAWENFG